MNEATPLDAAFLAMEASPEDEAARLRFHERLMDAELFVLLETEPEGDALRPAIFDLDEGRFALAFDRDARLAAFLDAPAPYAALAGRRLAAALAGRGVGLGLNLGVAPSATLLPAAAIDWLAAMGDARPERTSARPRAVRPPTDASPALIAALDAKIATMTGQIDAAWLAALDMADGAARLVLAVGGAVPSAEPAIAAAVAEAARFSGGGAEIDVAFLRDDPGVRQAFERNGLRFDPPPPQVPEAPRAPGSDPDRPPVLRR
ncbi:SseB family protein [Amaricoccus sp.]|uniref:SseB family protein n=1 Tax=Amaricoccus sp. TaxID=1872485 RepID=UPI001B76FA4F|nr:SseB family protein [Amaricoccus sp.]MBP7001579.1 SseB family protein [Amaricoccus sp.]